MTTEDTISRCYLCGTALTKETETRDHIPPKGLFARPLPALITVPSCEDCNNSKSEDEEFFRLLVTAGINQAPETQRLYQTRTVPRTIKRGRLKHHIRKMLATARPIWANNKGIIQKMSVVGAPTAVLKSVCENVARGLTAHFRPELLVHTIPFQTYLPEAQGPIYEVLAEIGPAMKPLSIGGAAFNAHHGIVQDSPADGIWILNFHQRICAMVFYGACTVNSVNKPP